jgi:biopolymer transport protein ExbD
MNLRRKKNKNNTVEEIDITSLLDILVILLVFLLQNFTDSELSVDIAEELSLPFAMQRGTAQRGIVLQVNSKNIIFYNKNLLGFLNSPKTIERLSRHLQASRQEMDKKLDPAAQKAPKLINLIFDKALEYQEIDKVLEIAAESGFGRYKLIVQGDE